MRDDEEVFLQHPGLKAFARDPVPGEFFPQHLDARAVVVVRLGPGLRVRTPMDLTPEQCTAPGVLDWITARFGCPCGGRP
jgi:hypothetical protein